MSLGGRLRSLLVFAILLLGRPLHASRLEICSEGKSLAQLERVHSLLVGWNGLGTFATSSLFDRVLEEQLETLAAQLSTPATALNPKWLRRESKAAWSLALSRAESDEIELTIHAQQGAGSRAPDVVYNCIARNSFVSTQKVSSAPVLTVYPAFNKSARIVIEELSSVVDGPEISFRLRRRPYVSDVSDLDRSPVLKEKLSVDWHPSEKIPMTLLFSVLQTQGERLRRGERVSVDARGVGAGISYRLADKHEIEIFSEFLYTQEGGSGDDLSSWENELELWWRTEFFPNLDVSLGSKLAHESERGLAQFPGAQILLSFRIPLRNKLGEKIGYLNLFGAADPGFDSQGRLKQEKIWSVYLQTSFSF